MSDQLLQFVRSLLKQPKPSDAISVLLYYHMLVGGKTDLLFMVTTEQVACDLKCSVKRIRRARRVLLDEGWIEDAMLYDKETGRAVGHAIQLKSQKEACNPAEQD